MKITCTHCEEYTHEVNLIEDYEILHCETCGGITEVKIIVTKIPRFPERSKK